MHFLSNDQPKSGKLLEIRPVLDETFPQPKSSELILRFKLNSEFTIAKDEKLSPDFTLRKGGNGAPLLPPAAAGGRRGRRFDQSARAASFERSGPDAAPAAQKPFLSAPPRSPPPLAYSSQHRPPAPDTSSTSTSTATNHLRCAPRINRLAPVIHPQAILTAGQSPSPPSAQAPRSLAPVSAPATPLNPL